MLVSPLFRSLILVIIVETSLRMKSEMSVCSDSLTGGMETVISFPKPASILDQS